MDDLELDKLYSKAVALGSVQDVSKTVLQERVEKLILISRQGLAQHPKGFFNTHCPKCNRRVKAQDVDVGKMALAGYRHCVCGWEYAEIHRSF